MTRQIIIASIAAVVSVAFGQADTAWVRHYQQATSFPDQAMAPTRTMAVGADGSIVIAAYGHVLAANSDLIVHKYDSVGNLVWVQSYDDGGTEQANALALDECGAVYVAGRRTTGSGTSQALVVKWDAAGNFVWAKKVQGDTATANCWAAAVAAGGGRVYVAGTSQSKLSGRDFTVWALDAATGAVVWTRRISGSTSGSHTELAADVALDENGLFVAGYLYGIMTGYDGLAIRLNCQTGSVEWEHRLGGNCSNEFLGRVAVRSGLVAVTGYWYLTAGDYDMLTALYSASGELQWSQSYAGTAGLNDQGADVAIDDAGCLFVAGYASNSQASDIALLKYDRDGALVWARFYDGGGTPDRGYCLGLDEMGNPVVAGTAGGAGGSATLAVAAKYFSDGQPAWSFSWRPSGSLGANQFYNLEHSASGVILSGPLHWGFPNYVDPTVARLIEVPDVGVIAINSPTGQWSKGTAVTPAATVKNNSPATATFWCRFSISDGYVDSVQVALPGGGEQHVAFRSWVPTLVGNWVAACSAAARYDYNRSNDRTAVLVNVAGPAVDVGVRSIAEPVGDIPFETPIRPTVSCHNFGTTTVDILVHVAIERSGQPVFSDSVWVRGAGPNGLDTVVRFRAWVATVPGYHTLRCWTSANGDADPSNDTLSIRFGVINMPLGEWRQCANVPAEPSGAPVATGGALDGDEHRLYLLKGNKTLEVFAYDVASGTWSALPSLPAGPLEKPVHKGSAICADGLGRAYVLKGNKTFEFYRYDPATGWTALAPFPAGAKSCPPKSGVDLVHAIVNDTGYVYAIRGSNSAEFYRYNSALDLWEELPSAPAGAAQRAKYKEGTGLAQAGDSILFCVKGGADELHCYDLRSGRWLSGYKTIPLNGTGGRNKKVKAGAGVVWGNGCLALTKGGGTNEFWRLDSADSVWREYPSVPGGAQSRRIKDGGGLAWAGGRYFVTKGGKSFELWEFVSSHGRDGGMAQTPVSAVASAQPLLVSNPARQVVRFQIGGRSDGSGRLVLFDALGRMRQSLVIPAGAAETVVDLSALEAGQYFAVLSRSGEQYRVRLNVLH